MTTIVFVILGILLAAAAALMAVFYGGDAFGTGSVKAQANATIGKVQQVAYAVQLRNASTGQKLSSRTYNTNTQMLKDEKWLSQDLMGEIVTVDIDGYGMGDVDHVYVTTPGPEGPGFSLGR
jgi:hypothetical protein